MAGEGKDIRQELWDKGAAKADAAYMRRRITIDPITRLEGHGKIDIFLDDQRQVERAYFQVPELRGFAKRVAQSSALSNSAVLSIRRAGRVGEGAMRRHDALSPHRTGRADFPHPALREASSRRPSGPGG